uniref:Solute carrier family 12 member 8 n=1 Tax=Eptatretus burgeri TaxID=7764 RepID=A0A8C4N4E7_EPTBU
MVKSSVWPANSEQNSKTALLLGHSKEVSVVMAAPGDSYGAIKEESQLQELFYEETQAQETETTPWWQSQFFVREPVLFGTWDGVFTSCLINIFGVVIFLRTGWMVGNVGVLLSVVMVFLAIMVALVTVLSGIGICERCKIGSGGTYYMIAIVLGSRVGGTTGLLYVFGQCVVGALYVTGFAESVLASLDVTHVWAVRGLAVAVLLGLLAINLAGVIWVIRLQLVLLVLLAVSMLDFVTGSFTHLDPENGFVGYSETLLRNNTFPEYLPDQNFFTVFGIFFPTATGVMAGFNMSGDLNKPSLSIPVGSLCALAITWFLYLVFVLLLGSTCTRDALHTDFMIAEKVSLVGFLFLIGLYISSLASCMTSLYGAPRILQCIAEEHVIPAISFLAKGFGPNKTPMYAIGVVGAVTVIFIFISEVDILSPIVTINFLITYATVAYAYFALAMSYDLQQMEGMRWATGGPSVGNSRTNGDQRGGYKPLINKDKGESGGGSRNQGSLEEFTRDMQMIFPNQMPNGNAGGSKRPEKDVPQGKQHKVAKERLQHSFMLNSIGKRDQQDLDGSLSEDSASINSQAIGVDDQPEPVVSANCDEKPKEKRDGTSETSSRKSSKGETATDSSHHKNPWELEIYQMSNSFYSKLCNRWISLIGAGVCLVIMFIIHWIFSLITIAVALLLFLYIGQASPGLPPGISVCFNFFTWIKEQFRRLCRKGPAPVEQFVVPPSFVPGGISTTQLTEENEDFALRERFHRSSTVTPAALTLQDQ